jgi:hypothetical protein
MFDPVVCAGMAIGAPRVDVAALVELQRRLKGGVHVCFVEQVRGRNNT